MMTMISEFKELFDDWITSVTGAVDTFAGRVVRSRRIQLEEGEDGLVTASMSPTKNGPALPNVSFRIDGGRAHPALPADWIAAFRGSRVEAQISSGQVMACRLDFPGQAGDFLEGMIRAQVDRLTPWTINDAVFGWSPPVATANERIETVFAATSKSKVQPLLQFVEAMGAAYVTLSSAASVDAAPPVRIKLLDKPLQSAIGSTVSIPRLLRNSLLGAGVAAAAALLVAAYLENAMDSEQSELQQQISQRRSALRLDANASGSGLGLLAKRKQTTPSSVMVLEAISRALPDTTYVTELRIEGDKVQVVGMTQDAPSLIRLIEQSPQFTRATFFAPTTHAANEPGERFHIEAHLNAYFGSGT
jgi:general secretion pathway protein L